MVLTLGAVKYQYPSKVKYLQPVQPTQVDKKEIRPYCLIDRMLMPFLVSVLMQELD